MQSTLDPPAAQAAGARPDLPDRYRLRGRLRRRTDRPVLIADDAALGHLVALKSGPDPEALRREAEVLEALDDPRIVRLRDDKRPDEIDTLATVEALFGEQASGRILLATGARGETERIAATGEAGSDGAG